jgi:hypothetical protein
MAKIGKLGALWTLARPWYRILLVVIGGWIACDVLVSIGVQRSPTDVAVIVARELVSLRAARASAVSDRSPPGASERDQFLQRNRLQLPIGRLFVLREPSTDGRPVVVSLAAFPDRPRPAAWNLWLAAPKHLACFEDGRVEFWTESRFQGLDLSAYTEAEQWLADEPVE